MKYYRYIYNFAITQEWSSNLISFGPNSAFSEDFSSFELAPISSLTSFYLLFCNLYIRIPRRFYIFQKFLVTRAVSGTFLLLKVLWELWGLLTFKVSFQNVCYFRVLCLSVSVVWAKLRLPPRFYEPDSISTLESRKNVPLRLSIFWLLSRGPYSGLHRAYLCSISIRYKWGYAYSFCPVLQAASRL